MDEAPARPSTFEAVRPDASVDEAATSSGRAAGGRLGGAPAARGPVLDAAVRCPSCGLALPATRRFCRCGATLTPRAQVEDLPEVPRESWFRRISGRSASFRRRLRAANQGVRVGFDRGRAAQAQAARVTAALAALGITAAITLPQASDVRAEARDRVEALDPRGFVPITDLTATTDPEVAAETGFLPGYAVDGKLGRAWSALWTDPADAGPKCTRPGGTPASLVVTLPKPTDVDQVVLVGGLPETSPDRDRQALPKTVDIEWLPSGRCTKVDLTKDAGEQSFAVGAKDVTQARLTIVSVHPPQDPPEELRTALAEVVLLQRGALGAASVEVPSAAEAVHVAPGLSGPAAGTGR